MCLLNLDSNQNVGRYQTYDSDFIFFVVACAILRMPKNRTYTAGMRKDAFGEVAWIGTRAR